MIKTTVKYDRLLKYMYDEFDKGRRELINVLITDFERISKDNRIGFADVQVEAVAYLRKNGWINLVDMRGKLITSPRKGYVQGIMEPTQKGREYLRQKRIDTANAIASVSGTFLGKLFRK